MRPGVLLAAFLVLAPLCVAVDAGEDAGVPIPGDDFVVTGHVKIKPGVYVVADKNGDGVLHVKGDGTTLDLTGVTLVGAADGVLPDAYVGVGVSIDGAKDVAVTGGAVRGFKIGVRAHDAPGVKLTGVDASGNFKQHLRSTVEREDESDWLFGHENDDGHWERDYGAGIALGRSPGAVVDSCTVRGGQNGVLLQWCDKAQVFDGDFSFNSGWGIALWRTCDATVCRNKADFCVRGYSHGRYARGQDSAGIFVFEQCSRNTFALNSATHGGDGFFLYAGNETLKKTGEGGCNENVVYANDFGCAVANGIEATFSRGNQFVGNRMMRCTHGIWAGYSYECTIAENHAFLFCKSGISIEHGHHNVITRNSLSMCDIGIHLWARPDPGLADSAFCRKHDCRSAHNSVPCDNFLYSNKKDVVVENERDSVVPTWNGNGDKTTVEVLGDSTVTWDAESKPDLHDGLTDATATAKLAHNLRLPGKLDPFAAGKDSDGDRKQMLVDEWGPVPPTETRLFPATQTAIGSAKLSALGVDAKFEVVSLTDGFVGEPATGDVPATIVVRRKSPGFTPMAFEITVKTGKDVRKARGTISSMPWDVRFFHWTADPRTDAEAWKTLLSGPPVETRRVDGLDYAWNAGKVSDAVGADHFGTLATSEVETAAGKWRLSTVSDDGIRVWVDGKLVVDDWTQHGPTPHDVDLDLAAGRHAVRVEHFELDGWAALRVTLAPAAK